MDRAAIVALRVREASGCPEERDIYSYVREMKDRIAELEAQLKTAKAAFEAFADLINNSGGVHGLHLNGDYAPWSDLLEGGRFEEWLIDYSRYANTIEGK